MFRKGIKRDKEVVNKSGLFNVSFESIWGDFFHAAECPRALIQHIMPPHGFRKFHCGDTLRF